MTADEMLYRAEVGYDIITGQAAEGITRKEWSLFLTQAQMDLIKVHLPVKGNEITFEQTELITNQFSELVKDAIDDNGSLTTSKSARQHGGISNKSTFYNLPTDYLYSLRAEIDYINEPTECLETKTIVTHDDFLIVSTYLYGQEFTDSIGLWDRENLLEYMEVNINSKTPYVIGPYSDNTTDIVYYKEVSIAPKIKVKPISHNYYNGNINNPLKSVYKELAWQMVGLSRDDTKVHEIISYSPPNGYYLRYLRMPSPIIIFDDDYEDDTDEIQGVILDSIFSSGASLDCEMDVSFHDNIVERAITRAQTALGDAQSAQLTGAANAALN